MWFSATVQGHNRKNICYTHNHYSQNYLKRLGRDGELLHTYYLCLIFCSFNFVNIFNFKTLQTHYLISENISNSFQSKFLCRMK